MKRVLSVLLALLLCLSLAACGSKPVEQDDSPITMYVGLGNGEAYVTALQQAIRDELGLEVELVYTAAMDTTSATRLEFQNNDLPADIICTASRTNADWLASSCLDLLTCTHLADSFTLQKIEEYTNEDGAVYQLPFTSKLIGITYNKTLLEENGWEVPKTFADMLKLKEQCDEKGILFAVSANKATGHGFNYLFHLMGADYLSTPEGTGWLEGFLGGTEDVSRFQTEADYFHQWVENGLFGSIHGADWQSSAEYCGRRALFFFDLTNSVTSYEGEQVDADGNGTGVMLHDEYASMPWISEDGTNNCYAYYDSMLLALNKKLSAPDQQNRLAQAVKILEFMTTETATELFTDGSRDGYVALKNFNIDETRLYYADREAVQTGYIMPWYYSYFDDNTIVNTGEQINTYLRGEGSSFSQIMETLQENQTRHLQKETTVLTHFAADLSYEETARLNAIGAVLSLQSACDAAGLEETVSAALVAYVSQVSDYVPFTRAGAVCTRAYAGDFEDVYVETIISAKAQSVMGVRLSGSRLKALAAAGLTDGDAVYPYVLVSREDIQDGETYLVAVSAASLSESDRAELTDSGAILTVDGETLTAPIKAGIRQFLQDRSSVSAADLILP